METDELMKNAELLIKKIDKVLEEVIEFKKTSPLFKKNDVDFIRFEIEERKYSSNIIVGVFIGENGKEKKQPVIFAPDEMNDKLVKFLNKEL